MGTITSTQLHAGSVLIGIWSLPYATHLQPVSQEFYRFPFWILLVAPTSFCWNGGWFLDKTFLLGWQDQSASCQTRSARKGAQKMEPRHGGGVEAKNWNSTGGCAAFRPSTRTQATHTRGTFFTEKSKTKDFGVCSITANQDKTTVPTHMDPGGWREQWRSQKLEVGYSQEKENNKLKKLEL